MRISQARRFGEALVARHVVTKQLLEEALGRSGDTGEPIDKVIGAMVPIPAKDLAAGYAAAEGVTFCDLDVHFAHPDAVAAIPPEVMRAHHVLGITLDQHRLQVAFPLPIDSTAVKELTTVLGSGVEVEPLGAERNELDAAIADALGDAAATSATMSEPERELVRLLTRTLELGGSDLHLAANHPPFVRILGELVRMPDEPVHDASRVRDMCLSIITGRQREAFERDNELDTAYAIPGKVRLRVNLFIQRGAIGGAFRMIPFEVVPFDQLGIPPVVAKFAELRRGLVLVTGPTGSGKSTTLASIIDLVNQRHRGHIITIEDPIEFVHQSKQALVNQREVGNDTASFSLALRQALRQDPDVVLVGEMRDLDTIATAISAAETGHLVFATLHTQDSAQTIDRIVDAFPSEQQAQVRSQVSNTIQGILTQQLVPTADGKGRVPACEVLVATPALRALIRDGKVHQISNVITSGRRLGMQLLDEHLQALVRAGTVTPEMAVTRARDPESMARIFGVPGPAEQ